jgi:hypothetical protein
MPSPEPTTLRLHLYWSYANLAMAHAAVERGATKYGPLHYMIRARLYKGLHTGAMNIRSLLDDEKIKMNAARVCAYCNADAKLTIDHLLPKHKGGWDSADNAVWVCGSCNSSKGATDVLVWWPKRHDDFPPLMLLRRYLKSALGQDMPTLPASTGTARMSMSMGKGNTALRLELLAAGKLVEDGTLVRFADDVLFATPSQAACMVSGTAMNGWKAWKNADGIDLDGLAR